MKFLVKLYIIFYVAFLLVLCVEVNAQENDIKEMIVQTSLEYGVDPNLSLAIAEVESNFNPSVIGSKGEIGLFQLRPEYHPVKRGNVNQNIRVAVEYLSKLQGQCSHYGDAFFVCYNLGPSYKRLKYPRMFSYYKRVHRVMKRNSSRNLVATILGDNDASN